MNDSMAYKIGEVAGVIMVLLLMLGICVLFVIALVKAITTRRTGWIVTASCSGLPFLLFVVLFLTGMVMGFSKAINRSNEIAAAKRGVPSDLLTATMTPVTGSVLPYQVSLPSLTAWSSKSKEPFDYLFNYRDAYVGIIPEGIGLGTPQKVCAASKENLASKASTLKTTAPRPIQIDSRSWLTYDAAATIKGIKVKYRFYVYADDQYTIQIVTWTGPVLFDHYAPVFDRIAKSFKMPASGGSGQAGAP